MQSKKMQKKGFSLLELLVGMAIIAVLLGLVAFGISTVQRNSRDTQRRQAVADMRLAIQDFQIRYNQFPTEARVVGTAVSFRDSTNTANQVSVNLTGAAVTRGIAGATDTTASETLYVYSRTATGYSLCAKLEDGAWYDQSQGSINCGGAPAGGFITV